MRGKMNVRLDMEQGPSLSKEHGFTVEEENGQVIDFDYHENPEIGGMLLFGNQIFALSFWSEEQLDSALSTMKEAVEREKNRRRISNV